MQKLNEISFNLTHLLFIVALYSSVMLLTSSWWGVIETSEARYAEISREMFYTGDYLHPQLLEIKHYHKPPITYWFTCFGYTWWGVNPFGVRFFLIITYALQGFLIYQIALLIFQDNQKSFWSAFIYSNLLLVLISVRALTTDAYNNLFILLTVWMALNYKRSCQLNWLYATALLAGLAFLTKGPIVLIMLVPAYTFIRVKKEKVQTLSHTIHYVMAAFIFCALGFSWYVYLISKNKSFLDYFVIRHFVDRFVHAVVFLRHQPWYFYLIVFPALCLPWIIPFVINLKNLSREAKGILIGWVIIPLIIFSLASSKLVLYILPLAAGFSFVAADNLWQRHRNQKLIFLLTYLLLMVGFFTIPLFDASIQLSNSSKIILSGAILFLIFIFLLIKEPKQAVLFSTVVFTISILLFSALLIKENPLKFNSITPLSEFIKTENLDQKKIIIYNRLLPSLAFELNKPVVSLYDNHNSLQRETQFETDLKWKEYIFDLNQSADSVRFQTVIGQPSVLITKEELPKNRVWLIAKYGNQKRFENWTLYY